MAGDISFITVEIGQLFKVINVKLLLDSLSVVITKVGKFALLQFNRY